MKAYWQAPALIVGALLAPLFTTSDAHACGGCYHRAAETETTVVTGHRMVLSVSTTQTTLWDQVEYSGDPSEFAWVLPVRKGAYVELATDAWFEALDAATSVNVVGPPLDCAPAPGARGSGCLSGSDAAGFAAFSDSDGTTSTSSGDPGQTVTVVHHGTVGPYATVTLATDTPGALNDWLEQNGFAVDDGIQPIIDSYIAEDFDFIALKLQPGEGVKAMKPVRVVTPGASPVLPLRMVAAGTGANVAISLFVISEGRFATKNFPNSEVPVDEIAWDHLAVESNYSALRKQQQESQGGHTWLTSYAKRGALLSPLANPTSYGNVFYANESGSPTNTIFGAYMSQAMANNEVTAMVCATEPPPSAAQMLPVFDPCPPDAMDPAECPAPPPNTIDARDFACGPADDLAVALTGLHPQDVWLTRLDAFLPRAALGTDLELEAAKSQASVDNWIKPAKIENEAEACRAQLDALGLPTFYLRGGRGGSPLNGGGFALLAGGLALAALARRAQRQKLHRAAAER